MTDAREPWSKFYWADWRSDAGVRACSYGARGLWMDLLALMAAAIPYGHLLINGMKPSEQDIAQATNGPVKDVRRFMAELAKWGVPGINGDGVWYSRRMLRDRERRQIYTANGQQRGKNSSANSLANSDLKESKPQPNSSAIPSRDTRASQMPEARSQREEPPKAPPRGASEPNDFRAFMDAFPRKHGRKAALKAWPAAIAKADPMILLAAAEMYRDDPNRDPAFTKHASTWLNQECWNDPPLPDRKAKSDDGKATPDDIKRGILGAIGIDASPPGTNPGNRPGMGRPDGALPAPVGHQAGRVADPSSALPGDAGGPAGGPAGRGHRPLRQELQILPQAGRDQSPDRGRPESPSGAPALPGNPLDAADHRTAAAQAHDSGEGRGNGAAEPMASQAPPGSEADPWHIPPYLKRT